MAYKSFEENISWQKSNDLVVELFRVLQSSKENWIKDELLGTALAASSQIAKGHEMQSSGYIQCLENAREGYVKCRSMIAVALSLRILRDAEAQLLQEKATDASKLAYGLLKKLKEKSAA
jgi:four helix bundle protein